MMMLVFTKEELLPHLSNIGVGRVGTGKEGKIGDTPDTVTLPANY